MASTPTFYFSNLTKTWHWIRCELCGLDIALIKDKLEEGDVICASCMRNEMKMEAMIARPDLYGL